tara:strand:+ start:424 stop:1047 length:624 start_codon:yes stop_codon:yes gene_type:complete
MKLDKINIKGEKSSIEILDKIFSKRINKQLISNVLYKVNANHKGRKAKTKQKNEIIGSTSKIYAQKGTGNARHASRKAPIFVGGGVAHGPKGSNNYKIRKINKSEKKLSISSMLTEKKNENNLIIFNDFSNEIKKTKEMNLILKKNDALNSLLIFDKESMNKIHKAIRNIKNTKITDINHFSIIDVLKYKKIIFTETSIKELEKKLI